MKNESEWAKKLLMCELRASHWEKTGRIAKLTFEDEMFFGHLKP